MTVNWRSRTVGAHGIRARALHVAPTRPWGDCILPLGLQCSSSYALAPVPLTLRDALTDSGRKGIRNSIRARALHGVLGYTTATSDSAASSRCAPTANALTSRTTLHTAGPWQDDNAIRVVRVVL